MILTSLRANQLSSAAMQWYGRYLEAFEAFDVDAYLSFLDPDCVVQANDRVPYYGHDGLREMLGRYFKAHAAVVHELLNIHGDDDQFATEMLSHFTSSRGGKTIIVPSTTFYDRGAAGLFTSIRHHLDGSALPASPVRESPRA